MGGFQRNGNVSDSAQNIARVAPDLLAEKFVVEQIIDEPIPGERRTNCKSRTTMKDRILVLQGRLCGFCAPAPLKFTGGQLAVSKPAIKAVWPVSGMGFIGTGSGGGKFSKTENRKAEKLRMWQNDLRRPGQARASRL